MLCHLNICECGHKYHRQEARYPENVVCKKKQGWITLGGGGKLGIRVFLDRTRLGDHTGHTLP